MLIEQIEHELWDANRFIKWKTKLFIDYYMMVLPLSRQINLILHAIKCEHELTALS